MDICLLAWVRGTRRGSPPEGRTRSRRAKRAPRNSRCAMGRRPKAPLHSCRSNSPRPTPTHYRACRRGRIRSARTSPGPRHVPSRCRPRLHPFPGRRQLDVRRRGCRGQGFRSGRIGPHQHVNAQQKCPLFTVRAFLFFEKKNLLPSCGVVVERRASVGSRWATRGGTPGRWPLSPARCPRAAHAPRRARAGPRDTSTSPQRVGRCSQLHPAVTLPAAGLNGRRRGWSGGGL